MARFPEGTIIEPEQVMVVAQTASGFQALFGRHPDLEIIDSDPNVADMGRYPSWATGDVALANGGDEVLILDGRDGIVDAISYGESNSYFAPSVAGVFTGHSIERIPADCDTDSAADWQPQRRPTPGEVTYAGECLAPVPVAELGAFRPIGEIQGRTDVSPYVNQNVRVRGVVTGMYEDRNAQGVIFYTLFIQDLPGSEDGDDSTSDGLAVFLGRQRPVYERGDQVRVSGRVTEFYGLTEIDDDGLELVHEGGDATLPKAVVIDPPADNEAQAAYLERMESMLVTIPGSARVVGPTHEGCGFAVIGADAGVERVLARSENDPVGQVVGVLHHTDVECAALPDVKSGDLVSGVMGPLTYHFDRFKIVQQGIDELTVTVAPPAMRTGPAALRGDEYSIATLNLGNHFDGMDDTGSDSEPKPSQAEIAIKQAKLAKLIAHSLNCPTILGVQEVEKQRLLLDLAISVSERCGFTYEVNHLESADVRGIDVALLSDPGRVIVTGLQLRQGCSALDTGIVDLNASCPADQTPLFSRPPLQVELQLDGLEFTLFVNHFKSKRDGAAVTAPRRLAQAQHINQQVAHLLDQDASARIIVMGDFNDYEASPTMQTMTSGNGRLRNPLSAIPAPERYSFIFDGISQLIDGILISPALVDNLIDVAIIHVNADYPHTLAGDVSTEAWPIRSTDHDPLLLILTVTQDSDERITATPAMNVTTVSTAVARSPTVTAVPEREADVEVRPVEETNEPRGVALIALLAGGAAVLGVLLLVIRRRSQTDHPAAPFDRG
jgi:endonuclease/exonuclease/phosphatase family metal-dependent hydrolase